MLCVKINHLLNRQHFGLEFVHLGSTSQDSETYTSYLPMWAQSQPCSYHAALNRAEPMSRRLHWAEISLNRVKGPGELEAAISGVAAAAVRAIPSSVRTEMPSSALRGNEESQAHGVPFRGRACLQHLFIGNAHRLGSVWRNCGFFPESWGTIM